MIYFCSGEISTHLKQLKIGPCSKLIGLLVKDQAYYANGILKKLQQKHNLISATAALKQDH